MAARPRDPNPKSVLDRGGGGSLAGLMSCGRVYQACGYFRVARRYLSGETSQNGTSCPFRGIHSLASALFGQAYVADGHTLRGSAGDKTVRSVHAWQDGQTAYPALFTKVERRIVFL